jgi:hydrogenase expression/formation protein HypC
MCIGIPMRVAEGGEHRAWCEGPDGRVQVDLALVGPQASGAWLLTFMGAAREVLDPETAARITAALDGLLGALSGDTGRVESAFADLIGRTPQLPEHLRAKEA